MKVYHVTYWDPCNGMGGRSQSCGHFASRDLAEGYIAPRARGWDVNAYSVSEIDVIEELEQ